MMNVSMSKIVFWTFLAFWQQIVFSEVVVRKWNRNEGSVCFMTDDSHGICRRSCYGQEMAEYKDNICNPGESPPLYCCVTKSVTSLYPTIDNICLKRMLYQEFIERGDSKLQIEKSNYASADDYIKEVLEAQREECLEESRQLPEEDREDFLEYCLKTPEIDPYDQFINFQQKKREYVTVAGLLYRHNETAVLQCTGIFIHTFYLITTASCITKAEQNGKKPNRIKAYLKTCLYGFFPLEIKAKIGKIYIHENYSPGSVDNDIAIVQGQNDFKNKNYMENGMKLYFNHFNATQIEQYNNIHTVALPKDRENIRSNSMYWIPNVVCLWTQDWIPLQNVSVSLHSYRTNMGEVHSVKCVNNSGIACNICDLKTGFDAKEEILVGPIHYNEKFLASVPRLIAIGSFDLPCSANRSTRITVINSHLQWIENIISEKPFNFYDLGFD